MADHYPLTDLPRALIEAGYSPVTYRAAYNAALNGSPHFLRGKNGRWTFDLADLGAIAEALGATDAAAA